jgi:hypothetical protein
VSDGDPIVLDPGDMAFAPEVGKFRPVAGDRARRQLEAADPWGGP